MLTLMRKLLFLLSLLCTMSAYAETKDIVEEFIVSPLLVNRIYDKSFTIDSKSLVDLIDKENKVSACIKNYIETQSKTYGKRVQSNLYDLMHNFDKIISKISGKKSSSEDVPFEDKIEALAKVQCDAYYSLNALR